MLQAIARSARRFIPITFQLPLSTQNTGYAFRLGSLRGAINVLLRFGLRIIGQLGGLAGEIVEVVVLGRFGGRERHSYIRRWD